MSDDSGKTDSTFEFDSSFVDDELLVSFVKNICYIYQFFWFSLVDDSPVSSCQNSESAYTAKIATKDFINILVRKVPKKAPVHL